MLVFFCALLVARVPPLAFIGGTIDRGHIWLDELGCLHGTGRANIRNLRENETKTQTRNTLGQTWKSRMEQRSVTCEGVTDGRYLTIF